MSGHLELNWNRRCPECPGWNLSGSQCPNVVPGEGPLPSLIMACGEGPGKQENFRKRPFVGPTGQENDNTYFPLAGLDRESVRLENTVRCLLPNERKPGDKLIKSCSEFFLHQALEICQPQLVILMGAIACKLVGGLDLEVHHGLLKRLEIFGNEYWVYPVFHPAAGLRGMTLGGGAEAGAAPIMELLLEDFERLRPIVDTIYNGDDPSRFVMEEKEDDTEPVLLRSAAEVQNLFRENWFDPQYTSRLLGVDTEHAAGKIEYCQWCFRPGKAYVVKAGSAAMDELRHVMGIYTFLLHASGQDLEYLKQIGVVPKAFIDTQVIAYRLQNQPQGLKALAYRLCGMKMRSFRDLINDNVRPLLLDWLTSIFLGVESVEQVKISPVKKIRSVKMVASPLEGVVKHLMRYGSQSETYNVWKKWNEMQGLLGKGQGKYEDETEAEAEERQDDIPGSADGSNITDVTVVSGDDIQHPENIAASNRDTDLTKRNGKGKRLSLTTEMVDKALEIAGPMPLPDIRYVPEPIAVDYGGRDADGELRVGIKLLKEAREFGQGVYQGDWD
jgi:uracil-DNA glycosylase family 4